MNIETMRGLLMQASFLPRKKNQKNSKKVLTYSAIDGMMYIEGREGDKEHGRKNSRNH